MTADGAGVIGDGGRIRPQTSLVGEPSLPRSKSAEDNGSVRFYSRFRFGGDVMMIWFPVSLLFEVGWFGSNKFSV